MSHETLINEAASTTPRKRRGCLFYITRGLMGFVGIVVALVLLGITYQTVATEMDKGKFSPRGTLYTVNGHQMHIVCTGESIDGSPTVILEAGLGAESLWWYWVQNQLAEHTQVCAYDRPGMGWSEPTTEPRDAITIASELHSLLEQAGISAPYVMAGHSFGAIWTRIYASQYPDEVMGIVLVDSGLVNPQQFANQNEYEAWKASNDAIQGVLWGLGRVGLIRLTATGSFQSSGYPSEIIPEMVALQSSNQAFDANYAMQIPVMRELTEANANAEDFGDLPVFVLWASETETMMQNIPTLTRLHDELSTYSSNTATRIIDGTSHGSIIGNEQYAQQVTDAILEVIESAQTGEPLVQ